MVKTIKIKPVLLLKISLSYILIKILKYLPLVYALMFFYHTLSQVAQLFKAWWKKEKLVIQPIVINIRGLNDCLLYFAYLPKIWSFIVIYNAIAFKQGKVPKEAINVFFFPLIPGKPFWFLKGIIKWVWLIFSIIFNPIWKGKKIRVWPWIFYDMLENTAIEEILKSDLNLKILYVNRKIIFDEKLFINPVGSKEFLEYMSTQALAGNVFMHPKMYWVYGNYIRFLLRKRGTKRNVHN